MNLAFQDAEALADCLATGDGAPALLDRACRRYRARRRQEVKRVLRLTHFMGVLGSLECPSLIRARETLLRACNRSRQFKKRFVQRVMDVG